MTFQTTVLASLSGKSNMRNKFLENRNWVNWNRHRIFLMTSLLFLFGNNKTAAQETESNFYNEYKNPTEYLNKVIKADSTVVIDTVYIKSLKEGLAFRHSLYNPRTNSIHISLLEIEPSLSQTAKEYNTLQNGVRNIANELPAIWIHESKHKKNAQINLMGLNFEQLTELMFWDEVSARIAELLLRRDVYLKSEDLEQAFIGVKYGDEYKSKIYKSYAYYLSHKNLTSDITKHEAKKLLELAVLGFTEDKELYAKTIPGALHHRVFKTGQECMLALNSDDAVILTDWDVVMTQMFEFDNCNIWKLCGSEVFEKQKKKFQKIIKRKSFQYGIEKFCKDYGQGLNEFTYDLSNKHR